MSEDYLLSSFEVAELFYLVINKYTSDTQKDTKDIRSFAKKTPNSNELSKLLTLCDQEYSEVFSRQVLNGQHKAGKGKSPRLLYYMMLAVKRGLPYLMSGSELSSLLTYLNIDHSDSPYASLEPRYLTNRLISFENSRWELYYPGQDVNLVPRIGLAILEFLPFGRVRIKTSRQGYSGYYKTFSKEEDYLKMNLKTIPYNTRDLSILVFCGPYEPELMLGQFHNVERKITSGKIIMIPYTGDYDSYQPKHHTQDSDGFNKINELIRKHILGQSTSEILTPSEITTFSLLERYVKHGVKY